jgi:hypothetical protein
MPAPCFPRTTTSSHALRAALIAAALCLDARGARSQTPVFGVHVAGPVSPSVAVGVWVGDDPRHDQSGGAIALVEPGLHGGRLSLGYAYALRGGFGSFVTARASLLRTWRVEGGPRNYAGIETQVLPLLAIGPRLGAFIPIDGGPRKVLWLLDVGIGL